MISYKTFIFCLICFLLFSCRDKAEPEMFLILENYTGPILVIFNQSDGQKMEYKDNRRIYRIPEMEF